MKTGVLEVLPTLKRAGAERVAVSIAKGLDRGRFEPAVVSLFDPFPGGFEAELEDAGVTVRHLGKQKGMDARMWARLADVLRDFRPAVVHTHSYVLRYVWPASWGRHVRIVHTVHNVAEREVDAAGRMLHRAVFRAGGVPVAISAQIAESFARTYGFPPARIIPNGVDTRGGFRPGARVRWRAANGFVAGDLLVVSAARLEPQKNPLGLIEAFRLGLGERREARLLLAGEGSLLDACRARAEDSGLAGRVSFLGLCRDVPELLSACDIFALASDWEGAPVAVIEAMAARLPVVATQVGGVPELVQDGLTGLLAAAGDMQCLGAAMLSLAMDPQRRQALGEAGAKRAEGFDDRDMVAAYARLFEDVAG